MLFFQGTMKEVERSTYWHVMYVVDSQPPFQHTYILTSSWLTVKRQKYKKKLAVDRNECLSLTALLSVSCLFLIASQKASALPKWKHNRIEKNNNVLMLFVIEHTETSIMFSRRLWPERREIMMLWGVF